MLQILAQEDLENNSAFVRTLEVRANCIIDMVTCEISSKKYEGPKTVRNRREVGRWWS
jgi:hypothetical protein